MKRLDRHDRHLVRLTLNGEPVEGYAEPRLLLTDFLRYEIGATGTHVGCEHGICGACTIRIDGKAVRSCLMLAIQVDGAEIQTIEGLAELDGSFGELQQAFHENFALQCGFCTPGFLMSLSEYLEKYPDPTREEIKIALSGNLCRCTGYHEIINASLDAAKALREKKEEAA
ncbi:MAG: (2Fe-2S)-binding protein [Alphaproteobacteria bacterium]|nr:(2Fe-2S)-binding protein [Alphaproteobacteria bacterium]